MNFYDIISTCMKKRVVVAMSGGVDSSVAAALLRDKGHEVIGITMCFNLPEFKRKKPGCCSLSSIDDARRVAHKLGIKHYVLNMQKELEEYVISDFCSEYIIGKTPNPCIVCNQYIKFGSLLRKSIALGGNFLATGHYARIIKSGGLYYINKAEDLLKDQSYFLYRLGQKELSSVMFPIGGYSKEEIRKLARKFKLPVAEKKESQEICFLPRDDYREFLRERVRRKIKSGFVVDLNGRVLGEHKGIAYYTIGQRQGLGIAAGYPAYILEINREKNSIIIGPKEHAFSREFWVNNLHFAGRPIKKRVALKVKIRYNHKEGEAELIPSKNTIRIKFRKPQFAVTPGQAAVFYTRSRILGGGKIEKVIRIND
ncbi:MAG: tRNA 2-thiouridine(34) synthase MnmA [Candidatus Omnitrophica bacterium]|nr:tRNA 2-thiouridine(34) synthase MnmA [Candidatus Omnitrophota bacterium]MDD5665176.1 tRNA 2-thiouridine(34) synthase MnmA [Candidatus Omnitrophota bacterium]